MKQTKTGFLYKKGSLGRKWQKKWFSLSIDSKLSYRKGPHDTQKSSRTISLARSIINPAEVNGKEYCFVIVTAERAFHLCAENRFEYDDWFRRIQAHSSVYAENLLMEEAEYYIKESTFKRSNLDDDFLTKQDIIYQHLRQPIHHPLTPIAGLCQSNPQTQTQGQTLGHGHGQGQGLGHTHGQSTHHHGHGHSRHSHHGIAHRHNQNRHAQKFTVGQIQYSEENEVEGKAEGTSNISSQPEESATTTTTTPTTTPTTPTTLTTQTTTTSASMTVESTTSTSSPALASLSTMEMLEMTTTTLRTQASVAPSHTPTRRPHAFTMASPSHLVSLSFSLPSFHRFKGGNPLAQSLDLERPQSNIDDDFVVIDGGDNNNDNNNNNNSSNNNNNTTWVSSHDNTGNNQTNSTRSTKPRSDSVVGGHKSTELRNLISLSRSTSLGDIIINNNNNNNVTGAGAGNNKDRGNGNASNVNSSGVSGDSGGSGRSSNSKSKSKDKDKDKDKDNKDKDKDKDSGSGKSTKKSRSLSLSFKKKKSVT
ncbi:hypothetical protein SAMD00019534_057030 [Acytostelium subglobosum LB1]|uniref:hypothetical protein n=1 Tax=Acytostelium subglobosum LB1 TaxID=1410327 RepID=UPI00064516C1|nr:hypothetical protein SAMD00019534_057030 [Acytostelium subglobosum LB1]GAM22528.1 hypothetical protein SAMD00019534_057030 [Acytostelium subglobosum LB1]|eukprot:XP_012754648.1 hypothetical protein SAMD00019534_057030 [Acytostelium subglobosum LB1]